MNYLDLLPKVPTGAGLAYELLTNKRLDDPKALERYGFKVYSQNDEDGIIEEIFNRIGTTNKTFVEFGVQNGLECNSHYLLHKGWHGLWIEGNEKFAAEIGSRFFPATRTGQLRFGRAFITKDNINELFAGGGIVGDIDLLSIDIDGNDYYVWKAIKVARPRVVVIEYNAKFPPNHAWVQAYNAKHTWDGSDWMGASLKALELLGRERGYRLVGTCLNGVNAFFVRAELAGDHFLEPATSEALYNPARYNIQYSAGHPARYYLGNQLHNIGMVNYSPTEYEKFRERLASFHRDAAFEERLKARLANLDLPAHDMCYQLTKSRSKFYLPYVQTDSIQQLIVMRDDYFESDSLERLAYDHLGGLVAKRLSEEGSVVVDIGANIGNHTVYFANELGASKVISFEPVPDTFRILSRNIELNNLGDRVELHNAGLSSADGKAEIAVYRPDNIGGTSLKTASDGDMTLMTLDEMNLQSIAFIKLDVEGMELEALKGALETIKRTRPIMFVESFMDKFPSVEEFFERLNYRYITEDYGNWYFYPAELENYHDATVEDYDLIVRVTAENVEKFKRALPSIEKYLGYNKIIATGSTEVLERLRGLNVETRADEHRYAMMSYALECEAEYFLAWKAEELPLNALYFRNRLGRMSLHSGIESVLIKTSTMREMIEALGGFDNIVETEASELDAYRRFVAERHPNLYVKKQLKVLPGKAFDRTLTAEELSLLPFDVLVL